MAAKQAIEVAYNLGKPRILAYKEKATQTFKKGAICILDSNGFLTEGGADPTGIWGVAIQDGHNGVADGDYECQVALPGPDAYFIGNIGGAVATALAQLYQCVYGVVKESNFWHVDTADTTNTRVAIVDFVLKPGQAIGETNGQVIFKFLASAVKIS